MCRFEGINNNFHVFHKRYISQYVYDSRVATALRQPDGILCKYHASDIMRGIPWHYDILLRTIEGILEANEEEGDRDENGSII